MSGFQFQFNCINNFLNEQPSCVTVSLDLTTRTDVRPHQRLGISPPTNLRGSAAGALGLVFCPIAVWRRIAQGRREGDCRPSDCRIKAAACGESCCLRTVERSVTCHEVHFELQPAFSKNARKDKARRTSHANTPRMAQKDRRRAVSLPGQTPTYRLASALPNRRRPGFFASKRSWLPASDNRSRCDSGGGHSVAPRALRPFFWPRSHVRLRSWLVLANADGRISRPPRHRPTICTTTRAGRPVALAGRRRRIRRPGP